MGKILKYVWLIFGVTIFSLVFPMFLTGAAAIIADVNIADYSGLETMVKITPVLVWLVGVFGAGGLMVYSDVKKGTFKKGSKKGSMA